MGAVAHNNLCTQEVEAGKCTPVYIVSSQLIRTTSDTLSHKITIKNRLWTS